LWVSERYHNPEDEQERARRWQACEDELDAHEGVQKETQARRENHRVFAKAEENCYTNSRTFHERDRPSLVRLS